MTFPVNGTIPGPNDLLSQSQGQIQTNFANIKSWSAIDHIQYGSTNAGTHAQVTIFTPISAPSPSSVAGVISTQTVTNTELFFTNSSKNIQITNSSLAPASGQGFLPGGLQIRCGTANASIGGTDNTISPAFPTATLSVVVTSQTSVGLTYSIPTATVNASSFKLFNSTGTSTVYYIAIGY